MKKKIIKISIIVLIVLACGALVFFFMKKREHRTTSREEVTVTRLELLDLKPNVQYVEIPELTINNLNMLGRVSSRYAVEGDMGKISRAFRYRNIAEAVSKRFCGIVPVSYILAICAYESGGGELLCNSVDDGGVGGWHMQGSTATRLGLHTYDNCGATICNGTNSLCCVGVDTVSETISILPNIDPEVLDYVGVEQTEIRDSTILSVVSVKKNHGGMLRTLCDENKGDLKKLTELDDRFNFLLNADAAVRYLIYNMHGNTPDGFNSELEYAVYRYSGNHPDYVGIINKFVDNIEDQSFLQKMESAFNKKNPELTINGERADYNKFMDSWAKDNLRYGLEEYEKLPKVVVRR